MAKSFFQKLSYAYRSTALTVMNTFVALLVLNVILFAVFAVRDRFRSNPISEKYGKSTVNAVYPGLSDREINALLEETWSRPYIYEPFTQFKERPYQGTYINVDANGFRATTNQAAWPPQDENLNIFLFGGSTLFGYGVTDDQTIASYLQAALTETLKRDVSVYNFGRGSYYSTQERVLYENMLASGVVPDVAIFIDGLNDFYYGEPLLTGRFRNFVDQGKVSINDTRFMLKTALGRAVRVLRDRFAERQVDKHTSSAGGESKNSNSEKLDGLIQRYLQNKKLIEAASESFGVTPIFVWQPIPAYHYDQQFHPFAKRGYGSHNVSKYGYERLAEILQEAPLGENFLWCADIQKGKTEPLYVDLVHYSARFSNALAVEIATLIKDRSLIAEAHPTAL
ncbi:MAG: SGNH/GDSL hydrolase family protein [Verrucomicrobia bacterium]|nr:SGNH/GDSL hydrolase family protein [Verrucomicrobiota bacterium]